MHILQIYILPDSVVTLSRCGGIFNVTFIANFLEIVSVKEFFKIGEYSVKK